MMKSIQYLWSHLGLGYKDMTKCDLKSHYHYSKYNVCTKLLKIDNYMLGIKGNLCLFRKINI